MELTGSERYGNDTRGVDPGSWSRSGEFVETKVENGNDKRNLKSSDLKDNDWLYLKRLWGVVTSLAVFKKEGRNPPSTKI